MRKIILMTSAAVIAPISAIAQTPTCTATPDCASLGYTQSSCPENNGVRCPWGDAWFCTKTCSEMGFNYTCSGTGYAGGAGSACGGKYASCECAEGLNGKMVNVRQKRYGDSAVAMLHSVHLVISCSVTEHVIRIWCQKKHQ